MTKKILLTCITVGIVLSTLSLFATKSEISKLRIKKIADIIRRYKNAHEKLSDPYVQDAIFDEVGNELILEPEEKPNEMPVEEIAKIVRKKTKKRFPYSIKQIRKKVTKEADKRYKLAKKLDVMTITVVKGRSSYSITGVFYGYGVGGNSVRIGEHRPIAFFDLAPDSRAKFDEDYNTRRKKEYIDNKVRNYYLRKNTYIDSLFKKMQKKITEENEGLGYIYQWGKWRTAKNITEYLIEKMKTEQDKSATEENLAVDDEMDSVDFDDTNSDENQTSSNEENPEEKKENIGTASENLELAKLMSTIEERQLEIASSQYEVDADQGVVINKKRILWGLTVDEINMILRDELKNTPNNDEVGAYYSQTITFEKGARKSLKLYYINKTFYKVEIDYKIGIPKAMKLLWTKFNDRYGESLESKKMKEDEKARIERLAAIKNLCPKDKKGKDTHKWDKKTGKCKKCGVLKKDLYPAPQPLDQIYTWPGKITTAVLKVSMTPDQQFSSFVLIKENKSLKNDMEAIIEAEKKKKADEESRKVLEEYQSEEY